RFAPDIFLMRDRGFVWISPNLAKSTLGQPSTLKPPSADTVEPTGLAPPVARACFTSARTSSTVMRFLGPLPLTWARFTPSSRANLRTEGEACGRLRRGTSASAKDAVGDVRSGATDAMEDGAEAGAGAAAALGAASAGAGAGVGAGAAAAGAAAWGAPPVASTTRISAPWETLSPSLTLISLTTPPTEAGISMEALSDSTVIRLCSAWMVSPTLTRISMTSTASKSPMSGTTTG